MRKDRLCAPKAKPPEPVKKSIKIITLYKQQRMKGVTILKDERNNKKILQIDMKEIAKNTEKFEDFMDTIIAESRRDEKKIPWETAKKQLKKAGKL